MSSAVVNMSSSLNGPTMGLLFQDLCDSPRTYVDILVLSRPCVMPTETPWALREEHNSLETSAWKMTKEISLSARMSQHPKERVGDVSGIWEHFYVNAWQAMGMKKREEQGKGRRANRGTRPGARRVRAKPLSCPSCLQT